MAGTPPPPHPEVPPVPVVTDFTEELKCNFDSDLCGMTQDTTDTADFTLNSGPTPNVNTGPSADHTTGEGKFSIFLRGCFSMVYTKILLHHRV